MGETLRWVAVVEGLGILAFPLAFALAPALRDRGWSLAKPLALLLTTLLQWWLASFGLLPSTRWSLALIIALWGVVALALAYRQRRTVAQWLRGNWGVVLATEGVFVLLFTVWTVYRAYTPEIVHTEQPMDLMLYTVAGRARWFPPEDAWLAGLPVSYYYGGHLISALLGKLAGVPNGIGYNLALSTAAALAGVGAFGIGASLVTGRGWILAGGASTLALLFLPNLEGVLELGRALGLGSSAFWQAVEIKGLEAPLPSSQWYPTDGWWWWRATRVIDTLRNGHSLDYTIHEFPFFSFLLGDLHPHVNGLPFLIGLIGLASGLVLHGETLSWGWLPRRAGILLVMGVWAGALGFINAWDLPLGLVVVWGAILLVAWRSEPPAKVLSVKALAVAGVACLGVAVVAVVPFLPFYAHLDSRVHGILPVRGPVSQGKHLLIVWGQFGLLLLPGCVGALVRVLRSGVRARDGVVVLLGVAVLLLVWLMGALVVGVPGVGRRFLHALPFLVGGGLAILGSLTAVRKDTSLALLWGLIGIGVFLVLVPELFYVVDTFGTRMNTVFKLHYQAWALLALAVGPALYYGKRFAQGRPVLARMWTVWAVATGLVVLLLSYYPVAASVSKAISTPGSPTLDGLAYLDRFGRQGERGIIAVLHQVSEPGDVLVEAVGDAYTEYGFIAAATGIPTLLNWPGHQVQWRRTPTVMDGRAEAVQTIYTTSSEEDLRSLLEKYRVTYVVVGPRERRKYGQVNEALLERVLHKVLEMDGYALYRRR
ncbi:MAG: DUF2298 domain-containing protein [Dehalococcoidia bacterium]|nr:DUF2298 domain-containing protein [Dehalococcoidia bacterium]MDW8120036.1 DUF2298 domain-containing protein [Chloroflexota bacterium]